MNLTREDVEDILKLLDSTAYDELHLETDRFALRLRRGVGGWTQEHEARGEVRLVQSASGAGAPDEEALDDLPDDGTADAGPADAGPADAAPADAGPAREGLVAVRAPLPGVFYRAPKPGEPPFVEAGDHVEPETVVAILETMKLMNPVRAGAAGTVVDFAVANNEPADLGAVLLWLAPDAPDALDAPAPGKP